jgi:hypothetical protein
MFGKHSVDCLHKRYRRQTGLPHQIRGVWRLNLDRRVTR